MRETKIDTEVQRCLRGRNTEVVDQILAVCHTPPSQAAVQKDQALSLRMFEVVELHVRIPTLTLACMSI